MLALLQRSVCDSALNHRYASSDWREVSLHHSLSKQVSVCRLRLAMHQQPFRRLGVCAVTGLCVRVVASLLKTSTCWCQR